MSKQSTLDQRRKLGQVYTSTVNDNLEGIEDILKEVQAQGSVPIEQFAQILSVTSNNLATMWQTGRKTLRTQIAYEIIPDYPEHILKLSLAIDAITNLLDDLLDEVMSKEQRGLYILELVRVISLTIAQLEPKFQIPVANYFNKGICIVIPEIAYTEQIKATNVFEERLYLASQCYKFKSLDMDIYIELPLIELCDNLAEVENIVRLARIHRAICLVKKDYGDLERDAENGTETPIAILAGEGETSLQKYINVLVNMFEDEAETIIVSPDAECYRFAENARKLISLEAGDMLFSTGE